MSVNISFDMDRLLSLPPDTLESLYKSGILDYAEKETVKETMRKQDLERKKAYVMEVHKYSIVPPVQSSSKPRYVTYVYITDEDTGKRKRKFIAKTYEEDLIEWLYIFYTTGKIPEKDVESSVVTLETLYPEWMKYKALHSAAENNVIRVDCTWRTHYVGTDVVKCDIRSLTRLQLDTWVHEKIREGNMTRKQYNNFSLILRQMLEYAVMKELIQTNPFASVRVDARLLRKEVKKDPELEVFTSEEEDNMIKLAWEDYRTNDRLLQPLASLAVIFQFQTGMRVGEIGAVKYADIKGDTLHVCRMVREQFTVVEHTKSAAGDRMIYLTDLAKKVIEETKRYHKEQGMPDAEYIFGDYEHLKPRTIADRYSAFCKRLEIQHRSSHKARKTQISTLIDAGVNLDTVRRLSGHEDSSTTLRCYNYDRAEEKARKDMVVRALTTCEE